MRHDQIEGFPEKLDAYLEDLLRPMGRVERKHQARVYLDGLLRSEGRKNVARMANKILRTDVQALQQFAAVAGGGGENEGVGHKGNVGEKRGSSTGMAYA